MKKNYINRIRNLLKDNKLSTLDQEKLFLALVQLVVVRARNDFYTYLKLMAPVILPEKFRDGRHIKLVCGLVQETEKSVTEGQQCERKIQPMISLPPGGMKSVTCSQLFPSWVLGRHPNWYILAVGHTEDFAIDNFGRKTQDIVKSKQYGVVFPGMQLRADVKAAGRWMTTARGTFLCAGAGNSIAGRRAHIAILDDVISEQTAKSDKETKDIIEWYPGGLLSRLLPDGCVVHIGCLTADTRVTMSNGSSKEINLVEKGEYVKAFNQSTGVFDDKLVLDMIPQGKAPIFEVKTKNSSVSGTGNHPFLVKNDDGFFWVELSKLRQGDQIVRIGKSENAGEAPFYLTDAQLWMLGSMYGDGWVNTSIRQSGKDKGQQRHVTCWAHGNDEANQQLFLRTFNDTFGFLPKMTKFGYYRSDRKVVAQWFRTLWFEGNAKTKRLPTWVYTLTEDQRRSFLGGLIDSDGWMLSTGIGHFGFQMTNEALIKDIKTLCESLGYRVSNTYHQARWVKPPNSKEHFWAHSWTIHVYGREETPYTLSTVREIKDLGYEDEVYDLSVDGNLNFVANGLVVHNTRWRPDDLIGFVQEQEDKIIHKPDKKHTTFAVPALLDETVAKFFQLPKDTSYWPEYWPTGRFKEIRDTSGITPVKWSCLYMQNPIPAEGTIIKWDWCKIWPRDEPPELDFIVLSLDTAGTAKKENDPTGYAIWGVFKRTVRGYKGEDHSSNHIILLEGGEERLEFVDLLHRIREWNDQYQPDVVLVENAPVSLPLIQELERRGFPIIKFKGKGDKIARMEAAAPWFYQGKVHFPEKQWAKDIIGKLCQFPKGKHDDVADAVSQAIIWIRDSNLMGSTEYQDDPDQWEEEDNNYKSPPTYWATA
jgi:predicted phage terminase large subunit-like protein